MQIIVSLDVMLVCISGSGCVNARRIHSRAVLHHRPRESLLGETTSATPPCTYSLKFQLSIVLVCCLDDVVVMSQTKLVGKVRTSMAISAHNGVLWALRDKSVAQSVSHYQALCGHHWLSVHVQRGKPTLVNMFEGSTHLSLAKSVDAMQVLDRVCTPPIRMPQSIAKELGMCNTVLAHHMVKVGILENDLARARENVRKTENQAAQDKLAFKETLQQKDADFQVLDFLLSLLGC